MKNQGFLVTKEKLLEEHCVPLPDGALTAAEKWKSLGTERDGTLEFLAGTVQSHSSSSMTMPRRREL